MSILDDQEQIEFNNRWRDSKDKFEKEKYLIREAYAKRKISLFKMEVLIWKAKRKYRV